MTPMTRLPFAVPAPAHFLGFRTAMMIELQATSILLTKWKQMPDAPPSEYSPWYHHRDRHHPFSAKEISKIRDEFRRVAPKSYYSVFPEERPDSEEPKL
jgi:hypothetical protein